MTANKQQRQGFHPLGLLRRALMVTLALVLLSSQVASAQNATPEIIANGLNGPQGVLVDDEGMIWAIEAGLGGDETITVLDTETGEMVEATIGETARIVKTDPDSGKSTEISTLPSVRTPTGGYGGGRLVQHDGSVYASVGEWATPGLKRPPGMATIVKIGADGAVTEIAETWGHETEQDPYPHGNSHTHPYGMAIAPDGRLLYADAGGNALMSVNRSTGAIETIAVFEPMPGVFPNPAYDGELLTDPVPTAVVVRDGKILVSLLSGAPFVPGTAKVVEVGADGSLTDFATGLTMVTDLNEGPDGNLYATTFAVFGEQGPAPASGSVTRIMADGSTETVVEGLDFVTSIDFDDDGHAYVAINGVGPPGSGQIVRIRDLASTSSTELPTTGAGSGTIVLVIIALTSMSAGALLVRFRTDEG